MDRGLNQSQFETPILFLVFNRVKETKIVFKAIKNQKPKKLFIAADGPRKSVKGEIALCTEVRNIVTDIDWECELHVLFRDENLGCGIAVSSAISWFFDNIEEGIILEDDCLPNISFFSFAEQLLKVYRHEKKVMHITGNNFQLGKRRGDGSYYYSNYAHIWGWATWKRAWKLYDFDMKGFEKFKVINKEYQNLMPCELFESVFHNKIDTWDVQWAYTILKNKGLSIVPNISLVRNIGFDYGTHTNSGTPYFYKMIEHGEIESIKSPSSKIEANYIADSYTLRIVFNSGLKYKLLLLTIRLKNILRSYLPDVN